MKTEAEQDVINLEEDIFKLERYMEATHDLETSMGLYNLILILQAWR